MATVHLNLMAKSIDGATDGGDAAADCIEVGSVGELWKCMEGGHFLPCEVILALKVVLGDLNVAHGHSNITVAHDFLQSGEADTGAKHCSGISMPQSMRPDVGEMCSFRRISKCFTQSAVRDPFAVGEQEEGDGCGICRIGLRGSSEGKDALEDIVSIIVYRNPTFVVEFFEWDMECPLVST